METNIVMAFLAGIIIIGIAGRVFLVPLKKVLKLILNSILGGILIYIINWVGAIFGFHIGINVITSVFVRNIRNTRSGTAGCI